MRNKIWIATVIVIGCLGGCKHKMAEWQPEGQFVSGNIDITSKRFLIPRKLSGIIQKNYLKYIRKTYPQVVLSNEELLSQIPRGFLNTSIYFMSDESGVLTNDTEFDLPRGGGQIDLANVVEGKKGSFFMHFTVHRANSPKKPLKNLSIYFFSQTHKQQIDGHTFGAGCSRYMDVTNTLLKSNLKLGFHLNATNLRYLPVVGGTFYFVSFGPNKKIFLAAARIVDSRYPSLQCPQLN